MSNDKAYCIKSSRHYQRPCQKTDCYRHEADADPDRRMIWAEFECEDYERDEKDEKHRNEPGARQTH